MLEQVKVITDKIKNEELSRDIDELYAGGFWDLAVEISKNDIEQAELLYNIFWELQETKN